jgi:hypothetical protein
MQSIFDNLRTGIRVSIFLDIIVKRAIEYTISNLILFIS